MPGLIVPDLPLSRLARPYPFVGPAHRIADRATDQRPTEPVPEVEARCRRKPQLRPARLRRSQHWRIEAARAQGVQQAAGCRRVITLATAICHDCQALLWRRGMRQNATGAATAPLTGSV